jgi:hypothetical protein
MGATRRLFFDSDQSAEKAPTNWGKGWHNPQNIDFTVSWWRQGPPKIRKILQFFKSVGKCPPFCLQTAQQVAADFCGQAAS